jgi:LruC domain-containing protein
VTATDAAGNTSLPATYTWAISMTVPTVTLTGEPPAYSNNPTPSFTFVGTSPNGPMTSYICQVSGFAAQSCTSPYTTPNLSQGTYTIAVIGTDSTGTHSSPATYTWVVDLTPPTVTLTQTPLARTNQSTGTFAFTVTDNNPGATAQCSLDGEAATSCNASITYPNLTEGTHSFTIIATDIAGNVSQPVTYSWFIDLTPPTIQILGGPGNPTTSTAANFTLQASDPNGGTVAQLLCRLDNATFTTCNSTPQFSGLPIGAHTFYAEAVDSVGNMSAPASYSWNITGDTPVITITQQPANPSSTTIPAVVQYTVTDPVVASSSLTIQCGFDGAVASCPANGTQTLTNPSVGQHTFAITATNAVGNSASQTITWQSATVIQYPATSNMAAVTYEDNFPNPGDADYNDFITDFRIVETVNAQNQITKIFIDFYPRAVGSGSNHSFLMVLSGVKQQPSNITKTTTPTFNGNASNIILTHYDASGNVTSTQTNLSKTSDIVIFPSTHSLFGSGAIRNADGTPQIDTIIAEPAQAPNQSARLEIDIADPTQNLAPANGQINIAQFRFILHVIGYLTTVSAHQSKQSGSSSSSASTTIPQYSTTYGNTKDIDIIDVDPTNFDSKGYPFGFVIPTNWQWPAEFVNINTVYPQFANYRQYLLSGGASSNTSAPQTTLQWYQYPVQDSTQIYPLPAAPNLLPYPN